jgi:hypothetical protein
MSNPQLLLIPSDIQANINLKEPKFLTVHQESTRVPELPVVPSIEVPATFDGNKKYHVNGDCICLLFMLILGTYM